MSPASALICSHQCNWLKIKTVQNAGHLFACNTHPTDFSPEDLWQNPVKSICNFCYLDDRNLEWLDKGPDHGKQQQGPQLDQILGLSNHIATSDQSPLHLVWIHFIHTVHWTEFVCTPFPQTSQDHVLVFTIIFPPLLPTIQGLPNLIGRWLPTGQPSITIWLPNNDWWLPNSARHKMLTFGG